MELAINQAVKHLREKKVISFPTETVWALAADANCRESVAKIYNLKQRDSNKPLAIMVADIQHARNLVELSPLALRLANKFMPGPLTLILPKVKSTLPNTIINPNIDSIAIRIPDNYVAQEILHKFSKPIVATSVNISGEVAASNQEEVKKYNEKLDYKIDYIYPQSQYSNCSAMASTIVDLTNETPKLIRKGAIDMHKIKEFIF